MSLKNPTPKFRSIKFENYDNEHPPIEHLTKESNNNFSNEQYWQQQLAWYRDEIIRRKRTIPCYHLQEIFLEEYFRQYTKIRYRSSSYKHRVLEFGFGFGRHLSYLMNTHEIEFYGCDISPQAINIAKTWAQKDWIKDNLKLINPRNKMPYPDKWFDVIFTVSVLIHIAPEHLEDILHELTRICKWHILHLENPMTDHAHLTSTMHNGCWAHPLLNIYKKMGFETHILPKFTQMQSIYRVQISKDEPMPMVPDYIIRKMLYIEETIGDEVKRLQNEVKNLQNHVKNLQNLYDKIRKTNAMRLNYWLERHPMLNFTLQYAYNRASSIFEKIGPVSCSRSKTLGSELIINDDSNKILSVCHPHWQGVRSAAEGQSPNLLLLPEGTMEIIEEATDKIRGLAPTHIILNGFWEGYGDFITETRKVLPQTKVFYIHHGSFYQMLENRGLPIILAKIIQLHKEGIVDRIGFVKKGMANVLNRFGIESYLVLNRIPLNRQKYEHSWERPIRAFIPVTDHLRKNLHTQILAALMVEEIDEVHFIGPVDLTYLKGSRICKERLTAHQKCSRNNILDLIDLSTIVLYVTISECAPMVPLECFSAGVPCLTGATHGLLEDDPFLEQMLIVNQEDDPNAIVEAISRVKRHYQKIHKAVIDFSRKYDERANRSLHHFLGIEVD